MATNNANMNLNVTGNASGFMAAVRSATQALKPLDNALRGVGQSMKNVGSNANIFSRNNKQAYALGSSYKGLIGQVTSMNRGFNILASSVRQVGQGFQNAGTTASIFISLPVAAFLRSSANAALSFQNALIETRKTTGLVGKDLDQLAQNLRQLSLESPTDPTVLAEIAASWGRMGVVGVDAITQLTRVTDQLQIATTLTADQAVSDLGRIGNIYYDTVDQFVDAYDNLGSAINELGQANAVTENEIVSAALRMAPAARSMGLTIETLLAVATTAAATNASAERAGTQTASAISKSVIEFEKVSELTGRHVDEIKAMIREDPEGYFLDLAYSIGQVDDPLQRIISSTEIFGTTGGKSIQSLAAAFPTLAKNLAISNKAYADGISLQIEYERALDSVQNQIGILKNNVQFLSTSIANVLLPYITKFSALAIPAIQLVTAGFEQLNERTKIMIIGFGLLLAVLGPLTVALGSLLFSIGIIATGFTAFITFIGTATSSVLGMVGSVIALLSPLKLLALAFGAAAVSAYVMADELGGVAAEVRKYISAAYSWGYNLIASFASGIADAAALVYNTIMSVINSFIGLIKAFSPPREGPLKNIGNWGRNVIESFAEGMLSADLSAAREAVAGVADTLRGMLEAFSPDQFDFFDEIWGTLQSTLQSVGGSLGIDGNALKDVMRGAAEELAKVINQLTSGEITTATGALGGLGGILGEFTADIENLINLENRYRSLNDEIKSLEDTIKGANSAFSQQMQIITGMDDISANERAALLRQTLVQKATTEQEIEKKKGELEDIQGQIDQQEGIIKILTSLLYDPNTGGGGAGGLADTLDDIKDKAEGLGAAFDLQDASDALSELGEGALSALGDKFDRAGEQAETFIGKIQRARDVIAGFIAAIRGEEFTPEQLQELGENFTLGFEKGAEIRQTVLDFLSAVNGYYLRWLAFVGFLAAAFLIVKEGITDAITGINDSIDNEKVKTFTDNFGRLSQILYDVGGVIGNIATKLGEMGQAFIDNIDPDGTLLEKLKGLKEPLTSIGYVLLGITGLVFDNLDEFAAFLGLVAGYTADAFIALFALAGAIAEIVLLSFGAGSVGRLANNLDLVWKGSGRFAGDIKTIVDNIKSYASALTELFDITISEDWKSGRIELAGINLASWDVDPERGQRFKEATQKIAEGFGIINEIDGPGVLANSELLRDAFAIIYYIISRGSNQESAVESLASSSDSLLNTVGKIGRALVQPALDKIEDMQEIFTTADEIYQIVKSFVTGEIGFGEALGQWAEALAAGIDAVWNALTPVGAIRDAVSDLQEALKTAYNLARGKIPGLDAGDSEGGGIAIPSPDIADPDPEKAKSWWQRFFNIGPDQTTLDQTSTAVAARVGVSMETSLTQIPQSTYDPLATNLATWAAGEGATVIEESSLGLANTLGLGIETALGENYLFWNGLITSFTSWWDESGLTWASETAAPLVFNTINDKIYELFDTMMPTYQRIIFAYRKWYNTTKVVLVNIGKEIATTITDGIREIFDDADAYMNNLVAAMKSWIETNKEKLKEVGKEIGKIIGKAIVDEIQDKLDDLIKKYSSTPSGGGGGGGNTSPRTSASVPSYGIPDTGFSFPLVTAPPQQSSSPAMNFNVTINGNVDDDRRAREIADEIYRRIALDMRYA